MGDWFELRPVGLEFLDEAPMCVAIEVDTPLSRRQVWDAFTDPTSWRDWFPSVRDASYPDATPPYGVGTKRWADVDGQIFEETMLAWDDLERWTYRIDRTTAPLAHAQVESTELSESPDGGTRVRWILASDPREAFEAARDVLPEILERRLDTALRNLEQCLQSPGA